MNGSFQLLARRKIVAYYVSAKGRWNISWLLEHAWIESDFIPNKSAGFYPRTLSPRFISIPGIVKTPDDMASNHSGYLIMKKEVVLDACNDDIGSFGSCLNSAVSAGNNIPYHVLQFNCSHWAIATLTMCKIRAKM